MRGFRRKEKVFKYEKKVGIGMKIRKLSKVKLKYMEFMKIIHRNQTVEYTKFRRKKKKCKSAGKKECNVMKIRNLSIVKVKYMKEYTYLDGKKVRCKYEEKNQGNGIKGERCQW